MASLTDNFNDGTSGDDIATRPGWSTVGANYDVQVSDANGVFGTNTPAGAGRGGAGFDTGSGDHYAELELITLTGTQVGAAVRIVDNANWAGVRLTGSGASGLRLYKKIAGAQTDLTFEQGVANSVYRVKVEYKDATNSTYELLEDGVGMPDGPVDILNSELAETEQYAGIMNNGDNNAATTTYWDNFNGGSLVAATGTVGPLLDSAMTDTLVNGGLVS